MVKSFKKWLLIVPLLAVLLLNIAGIVIELLFSAGILETDLASIRRVNPISLTLSTGFVAFGFVFIVLYYKNNISSLRWWNAFIVAGALMIAYKLVKPTYLTSLIPYYFFIMFGLIGVVWILVFVHLKKELSQR